MSSFLEKEILGEFIKALNADPTVPKNLVSAISTLFDQDKISKGTNLKKLLDDYTPSKQEVINEGQ